MQIASDNRDRLNELVGLDNRGGRLGEMERADLKRDEQFKELATTIGTVDRSVSKVDKRLAEQSAKMTWLVGIAGVIGVAALTATIKLLLGS